MFVKRITDVTVARLRTVLHALVSNKALRPRRETSGLLNEAPRSSHRLFQVLVSVAVFPLVLAAMLVGSGTPAHAGPNGQQVYFQGNGPGCAGVIGTSEKIDHVIVSGTNPDNRQVEWQGNPGDGRTAWVAGWWWFGAVHVAYHGSESGWHDIYAYVPRDDQGDAANWQSGMDTVWVTCRGSIVHVYGDRVDMGTFYEDPACINLRGNPNGAYERIDVLTGYDYSYFDRDGTLRRTYSIYGPGTGPTVITSKFALFDCK